MTTIKHLERFARKFVIWPDGCWVWVGSTNNSGYGQVTRGRQYLAHRFIYELLNGPIPEGLELDHLCRNRACVNPGHLEPVTTRDNVMRGAGMAVINSKKTHCPKGHEYTPDNIYNELRKGVWRGRVCRACTLERGRTYYARKKAIA